MTTLRKALPPRFAKDLLPTPQLRSGEEPSPPRRLRLVESLGLRSADRPAAEIDALLFSLSRQEARSRRLLGSLAAEFLRLRGPHRLGFVRVDDHARERLGLSGRELQSLASVARRLEELPATGEAFSRGEISWSQARLLAGIVRPESEQEWLGRARGSTVRSLLGHIRAFTAAGGAGNEARSPDPVLLREAMDEATGAIDGEETARLRIHCPARVVVLWRRAVELARRMLGARAVAWRAAEAIAAEGAAAAPRVDPSAADARSLASSIERSTAETAPVTNARPGPSEPASLVEAFPRVAWSSPGESRSAGESCLDDPGRSLEGLDVFDLEGRMRQVVGSLQGVDARMGALLLRLLDSRLHRWLGFESFDCYVRERLGMSPSRARALVAVERRCRELPDLGRAWAAGELSWTRALTILPVAKGAVGAQWISRAQAITVRRLSDEVEWVLAKRDAAAAAGELAVVLAPPPPDFSLDPLDLQTCARPEREIADREVTFFGSASVVALFRETVESFRAPNEPAWRGLERLLLRVIGEWQSQPRHRDPIFERDGWRCTVSACGSRRDLHDHHRRYRSQGGGNQRWNRTSVCWRHHRAIHEGLVRAHGRAPDGLVWELGLRPGRVALLVLRGDRYLKGGSAA